MDARIQFIEGDITALDVDAIVNAANSSLMGGGGVDGAIHRAAGQQLKEACRSLGGCDAGNAKITPGFNLKARYVIHTVGPVWYNDTRGERDLLESAYHRSLEVAVENSIETIAFPSISTGAYRFPFDLACEIALRIITKFLEENNFIRKVYLVIFGEKDLKEMERIFKDFHT